MTLRATLLTTLCVLLTLTTACAARQEGREAKAEPARKSLRVYHLGNSVTDTLRYKQFAKLVASRGNEYVWGRQTIPGTPLHGLRVSPDKGPTQEPFGRHKKALADYEWDVLTLQPFDRKLEHDMEPDLASCKYFIDLALAKSPDVQVYVYARWPKRPEFKEKASDGSVRYKPFDYAERWQQPYSGKWEDFSYETRDYFVRLAGRLNHEYAGKLKRPVKVIPVGEALFLLDKKIKAGEVPGVASITDLYTDNVHFGDAGSYVVGLTFYATLYNDDPRGLPSDAYGKVSPEFAKVAQEVAWEAVSNGGTDAPARERKPSDPKDKK